MAELIQKVYAQALFDAAVEEDLLEQVRSELDTLAGICAGQPVFLTILSSPAVSREEKAEILRDTIGGRVQKIVYNFFRILADEQRAGLLPQIQESFTALYRQYHNILPVKAVTAIPMPEDQVQRLSERLSALSGKNVLLQNEADPALIGGVLLQYDGHELDGSVRERLDSLRRNLSSIVL